jgi:hypothetical protein
MALGLTKAREKRSRLGHPETGPYRPIIIPVFEKDS